MQTIYSDQGSRSSIYRLGITFVNWYLIETTEGITIVDAGFPGHWHYLMQGMAKINRPLSDIRAIILTHAHSDHVGFAERARKELGVAVWIHEQDAQRAQQAYYPIPMAVIQNMWRPQLVQSFMRETANGALIPRKILAMKTFTNGDVLPVPGYPRVIHTPGHTPGSVCFYLEEAQVLLSGDALATRNPLTMLDMPPGLIPMGPTEDVAQAHQSLHQISQLERVYLLPGHGSPWYGNIGHWAQALLS